MTLDELVAEGERLASPSLLLDERPSEGGIVAYWGGKGRKARTGRPDDRHRITIDCNWLSEHGARVRGALGVYDVDPRWHWPRPTDLDRLPQSTISEVEMQEGLPLYGHEARSLPPIQAVCLYGGGPVEAWLTSLRLERIDYDAVEVTSLGQAYQREYQQRCPLFSDRFAAVLGGWHTIWPDDEFYIPREMRLVLWTLRDAEPWIEVFERGSNLNIRRRIT